jgi:hypothetical protein
MERNARICLELPAHGKLRFEPLLSRVAKPGEVMGVVFDWSG